MTSAEGRDRRFDRVLELGRGIRTQIERADLEAAGDLVVERLEHLHVLFAAPDLDREDEMLAYWLQEIVREDKQLMKALGNLRERMALELGQMCNSSRSALEYAEVERG